MTSTFNVNDNLKLSNESTEVQTLGVIRIQLYYQYFEQVQQPNFTSTIDVRRSTHRLSIFEGRHINHRSSKVDTSIIGLRRSTHPSPKVDTSIFESRHIDLRGSAHRDIDLRRATHDLRRATYRSLKVDTSIIDLRKSTHRSSKFEGGNITSTIRHRILSTTALLSPWSRRSYTRSYVHCIKIIFYNI